MALLMVSTLVLVSVTAAASAANDNPQIDMGTTILAVRYKHGVIVGADTRTSVSGFVSNRYAEKISLVFGEHINDDNGRNHQKEAERTDEGAETETFPAINNQLLPCVVLCRSGSAADTQYLADQVKWELQKRYLRHGREPTVKQVAHLVRSIMRERDDLMASLICAGFDANSATTNENIYSILPGGSLLKEDAFAVSGSGSTFIMGHMDHHLVNAASLLPLEEEDAIKFVVKAISLAIARDASSGGFVRIYVMDSRRGLRTFVASPKAPAAARND